MDFCSSRLDGILWLPDHETQARIALTSTTTSPVTATGFAAGRGDDDGKRVTLGPHETELVEANSFIESANAHGAPAALVSIQHDAPPGAVVVTGLAVNVETGFSTVDQFHLTPSVVGGQKSAAPPSSVTIVWP